MVYNVAHAGGAATAAPEARRGLHARWLSPQLLVVAVVVTYCRVKHGTVGARWGEPIATIRAIGNCHEVYLQRDFIITFAHFHRQNLPLGCFDFSFATRYFHTLCG
jgi:hypothetical protein